METDKKPILLITGATSGVGLTLVRRFAGSYHILALGRNRDMMQTLFSHREDISWYQIDLSNPAACDTLFGKLSEEYTYIPYVINNAGIQIKEKVDSLTYNQMIESFHVNYFAPVISMQSVLPAMMKNNFGRIINITSGAPLNCFPGFGSYSSSKGALNAISMTAAQEYAEYNIKINLMSPGPVKSNMAPQAPMDPSVCHSTVHYLLNIDKDGPTGKFFWLGYEIPIVPNLGGIEWLEGKADDRYKKVVK